MVKIILIKKKKMMKTKFSKRVFALKFKIKNMLMSCYKNNFKT